MERIKSIETLLQEYRNELEDGNCGIEDKVYDLEAELDQLLDQYSYQADFEYTRSTAELDLLKSIKKDLLEMKAEFDFYDEETELNMMFPNRDDDDFDEDSSVW